MTSWHDYAKSGAQKEEIKKPSAQLTAGQIESQKIWSELDELERQVNGMDEQIDWYKAECQKMAENRKRSIESRTLPVSMNNKPVKGLEHENNVFSFHQSIYNSKGNESKVYQLGEKNNAPLVAWDHRIKQNKVQFGTQPQVPMKQHFQQNQFYSDDQFQRFQDKIDHWIAYYRSQNSQYQTEQQRRENLY